MTPLVAEEGQPPWVRVHVCLVWVRSRVCPVHRVLVVWDRRKAYNHRPLHFEGSRSADNALIIYPIN